MNASRQKRRIKLIKPLFQFKLVGVFVGLAAVTLFIQLFLLGADLRLLAEKSNDGGALAEALPGLLERATLFAVGMVLPVTLGIGVLVTHRIAGPVHRLEQHLRAIVRGEQPGRCHIRRGDEFQELCELMNEALEVTSREREEADTNAAAPAPLRKAG